MSDTGTTGTPEPQQQQQPEGGNAIQELRDAAERGRAATTENESLKREMAFLRANVDEESAVGKMFIRSYDGELTTEAIQAAATEVGALRKVDEPGATGEQLEQQGIRETLQGGGTGAGAGTPAAGANGQPTPDAIQKAKDTFKELVPTVGEDKAREAAFASVFADAAQGVPGAVFDAAKFAELAAEHTADPWAGSAIRERVK